MSSKIELVKELKKYIGNINTKKDAELVDSLFEEEYDVSLEDILDIMEKDYDSDEENREIMNILSGTKEEVESVASEEDYDDEQVGGIKYMVNLYNKLHSMKGSGKNTDTDKILKDSIKAMMSVKGLGNFISNKIKGKGKYRNKKLKKDVNIVYGKRK